jgi:uncharacterized protein (TIGR01777 family)
VKVLTRGVATSRDQISWNPKERTLDNKSLLGSEVVIHLGGEPILGRWTTDKKKRIEESRVQSTTLLAKSLSELPSPPHTFLCASAIGIYGHSDTAVFTENSDYGQGFLPAVCMRWEQACLPAVDAGICTANLRFGIVLSTQGGALAQMLPAFRFGCGGPLGKGTQMMSWIDIDDAVEAIDYVVRESSLSGPINVVAPNPVTNRTFSKALAATLHRPCLLPVPGFAVRLLFGDMGQTLLLEGQSVQPEALLKAGFQFQYPKLEDSLSHLLTPSQT